VAPLLRALVDAENYVILGDLGIEGFVAQHGGGPGLQKDPHTTGLYDLVPRIRAGSYGQVKGPCGVLMDDAKTGILWDTWLIRQDTDSFNGRASQNEHGQFLTFA
jgi:hypothetical protein